VARLDGGDERPDEVLNGRVRGWKLVEQVGVSHALADALLELFLAFVTVAIDNGRTTFVENRSL
jgi:hypothetical protein